MSIVTIAPAVVGFARPACECAGGGGGGGDCTPTTASITGAPEDDTGPDGGLTVSDTVSATYSYGGGPAKTITFSGSSPKYAMLMDLALTINLDAGTDLIDIDSSTSAPFAIVGVAGAYDSLHGGDGSATAAPADLVLSLTPGADHDAVAILFDSPVTVHSCGRQTWPGV